MWTFYVQKNHLFVELAVISALEIWTVIFLTSKLR